VILAQEQFLYFCNVSSHAKTKEVTTSSNHLINYIFSVGYVKGLYSAVYKMSHVI